MGLEGAGVGGVTGKLLWQVRPTSPAPGCACRTPARAFLHGTTSPQGPCRFQNGARGQAPRHREAAPYRLPVAHAPLEAGTLYLISLLYHPCTTGVTDEDLSQRGGLRACEWRAAAAALQGQNLPYTQGGGGQPRRRLISWQVQRVELGSPGQHGVRLPGFGSQTPIGSA